MDISVPQPDGSRLHCQVTFPYISGHEQREPLCIPEPRQPL